MFGRHVFGRAFERRAAAELLKQSRQSEVRDAYVAVLVNHHVAGLEVAVDDARVVRRGETGAYLPRYLDGLVRRQATEALEHGRKLLAAHELHRDEARALILAYVVNAADVAV